MRNRNQYCDTISPTSARTLMKLGFVSGNAWKLENRHSVVKTTSVTVGTGEYLNVSVCLKKHFVSKTTSVTVETGEYLNVCVCKKAQRRSRDDSGYNNEVLLIMVTHPEILVTV